MPAAILRSVLVCRSEREEAGFEIYSVVSCVSCRAGRASMIKADHVLHSVSIVSLECPPGKHACLSANIDTLGS